MPPAGRSSLISRAIPAIRPPCALRASLCCRSDAGRPGSRPPTKERKPCRKTAEAPGKPYGNLPLRWQFACLSPHRPETRRIPTPSNLSRCRSLSSSRATWTGPLRSMLPPGWSWTARTGLPPAG